MSYERDPQKRAENVSRLPLIVVGGFAWNEYWSGGQLERRAVVIKYVTPKQFVTEDHRFWRDTGQSVGKYSGSWLTGPATEEEMREHQLEENRKLAKLETDRAFAKKCNRALDKSLGEGGIRITRHRTDNENEEWHVAMYLSQRHVDIIVKALAEAAP